MSRFIATYRWEFWLIVGIPVIAGVVRTFAFVPVDRFVSYNDAFVNLPFFIGSAVTLLLRAVSLLRVRRLGREFLAVLWGYLVVVSVIGTLATGAVFFVQVLFPGASLGTVIGRTLSIYGLATLPEVLALLWFARRASRLSLTHAAFLLVYSSFTVVGSVTGSSVAGGDTFLILASFLIGSAIALTVMLTKVWLLGNFDRRGPRFRRDAVIALMATIILSGYARVVIAELIGYAEGPYLAILPLLGLIFGIAAFAAATAFDLTILLAFFALIYLVRVRDPVPEPEAEPPADLRVQ